MYGFALQVLNVSAGAWQLKMCSTLLGGADLRNADRFSLGGKHSRYSDVVCEVVEVVDLQIRGGS